MTALMNLKSIEPSSPEKIRKSLNIMEFSEIKFGNNTHQLHSRIDKLGEELLRILGIKHPKKKYKKAA